MEQQGKRKIARHPLHPIATHFPMALLPVSLAGDLLGIWRDGSFWWSFSFWCLAIGLILSVPAIVTGIIDFLAIEQAGPAESVAMRHMTVILIAIALFAGSLFLRFGDEVLSGIRLAGSLSLSGLGLIALLIGGWLGGELVYRHGAGSRRGNGQEDKE